MRINRNTADYLLYVPYVNCDLFMQFLSTGCLYSEIPYLVILEKQKVSMILGSCIKVYFNCFMFIPCLYIVYLYFCHIFRKLCCSNRVLAHKSALFLTNK